VGSGNLGQGQESPGQVVGVLFIDSSDTVAQQSCPGGFSTHIFEMRHTKPNQPCILPGVAQQRVQCLFGSSLQGSTHR
jgi:hypothetical protein